MRANDQARPPTPWWFPQGPVLRGGVVLQWNQKDHDLANWVAKGFAAPKIETLVFRPLVTEGSFVETLDPRPPNNWGLI